MTITGWEFDTWEVLAFVKRASNQGLASSLYSAH